MWRTGFFAHAGKGANAIRMGARQWKKPISGGWNTYLLVATLLRPSCMCIDRPMKLGSTPRER